MLSRLEERIAKVQLTKIETKIANYFLDNIESVCLKTATDLSLEIGVSDTSIIRLARTLGYSGFGDFQKQMKLEMGEQLKSVLSPSEKHNQARKKLHKNNLSDELAQLSFENLRKTFDRLDQETIERVVSIVESSNNKLVCGFRGTASLAAFFSTRLTYLFPNVTSLTNADSSVIEKAIDLKENDCVILFTFPIYSAVSTTIVELAKERGAKVIVITDKMTSPVVAKADAAIMASVKGLGFSNSYVAPLAVVDLLLLNLSKNIDEGTNNRISTLDTYLGMHNML